MTHAFGHNYTLQDMHQQTFPVLYRWDFFFLKFRVSRLEWVLNLQGGFSDTCVAGRRRRNRLNTTNSPLNLKARFNSQVRHVESLLRVVVYSSAKLSGMVCNSLLCLIIDRYLASRTISPLFWRPLAKLPLWGFDLCHLMLSRQICMFIYWKCAHVYVCVQMRVSTSHTKEWGLSLLCLTEQDSITVCCI